MRVGPNNVSDITSEQYKIQDLKQGSNVLLKGKKAVVERLYGKLESTEKVRMGISLGRVLLAIMPLSRLKRTIEA